MKDCRQEWYDLKRKASVVFADVTGAARDLANAHLSGPAASYSLSKALAAAALLGSEMSEKDESVSLQLKCCGPLGGINVECTDAGALRGYTEKKILDDFDSKGVFDDSLILGESRIQIIRSVPGRIISRGIADSLASYFADSLQRRVEVSCAALVDQQGEIIFAAGAMVELLPDAPPGPAPKLPEITAGMSASDILAAVGLENAELKRTVPLKFGCRCSPERAAAIVSSLSEEELSAMPEKIDITCHMCGRTFTVKGSGK